MRYVSYTRTSPWETIEHPMSIGEQNVVIETFSGGKGWNITKRYNDRKKQDDGEGMRRLISDGMARQYDGVVVAAFPYFGSDPATARQTAFEILYAAGIHFAVAEDEFDSAGLDREDVAAYFEQKRRDMHARSIENWLEASGSLMLHRYPPYGYKVSEDGMSYVKDEEVAEYVDEIFRQYLAGSKRTEIARWLNRNGILNRFAYKQVKAEKQPTADTAWNASKVTDLLENDVYAGKTARKYGGKTVAILCEPYITEEERKAVLARIESEKRVLSKTMNDRENPFINRIFSAATGESMVLRIEEGFVDKAFYGNCRELRKAHSIPFETVMETVKKQLAAEKHRAETAAQKISSREAEPAFREAREKLSERMRSVLETAKLLLADGLQNPKLAAFDEEAATITKELHRLEIAFSLKNPWIALFREAEISETISRAVFRKLAERVTVNEDYSGVTVEYKAQDMKRYLPENWWEGKED